MSDLNHYWYPSDVYNGQDWTKLKLGAGRQKPNHLSHHVLSPRVCISRGLESGAELSLKFRNYSVEFQYPSHYSNY